MENTETPSLKSKFWKAAKFVGNIAMGVGLGCLIGHVGLNFLGGEAFTHFAGDELRSATGFDFNLSEYFNTPDQYMHTHSASATTLGSFTFGEPGFDDCISNGGTTDMHGENLFCHG